MAEKKETVPPKYDVNAKWDACLDLTVRRFVYSSLGGAFAGLLFFRSPVTRWASVAFGAGLGIGSAYTDCSRVFDAPSSSPSSATFTAPNSTDVSEPQGANQ
ncbi:PREDICTED: MICOS complex subunit Mic10-like isoform X2 [Tarenaya hassleriana]|uniref:MICOS complex subunit Mic10-like isoform X2 n=1 Tax=Tarenaya hassleriana TaxID=28532 RepID=UPI00053C6372|nr:PREDICTED: MICOS complex subunit Mic10-like isoform X2 [Tarenaya hassleriana]